MSAAPLRRRWQQGVPVRLAWSSIAEPHLVEMAAATGAFDAVVLDMQHGTYDQKAVLDALRVLGRFDVTVLARIASADPDLIGWILDAGLDGVIVAMCQSADEARAIVRAVRYPPDGDRSYGVFRSTSGADPIDVSRAVVVLPMIESSAGLADVDAIVAVEGVDGVFIGPGDLGQSLGHGLGQNRSEPPMLEAFATVKAAAQTAGRHCGIFATTTAYAQQCAHEGYDLVVPWYDASAIGAALAAANLD